MAPAGTTPGPRWAISVVPGGNIEWPSSLQILSATPPFWLFIVASLVLGTAYGLCLQQGLVDVERLTPAGSRGTVIGIFYVFTYLGFGLPVLLEALLPALGAVVPLLALAGLAVLSALLRGLQLVRTDLFRHPR